ncbi:MAG: hexitol phosphatase HxpB [Bradymonadia bacterium]
MTLFTPLPPLGAIFDMDGLLMDSEPHWRQAELEVFRPLGVPLTEEMCLQTMGLRIDEVVQYWLDRHPWADPDIPAVADQIVERLVVRILSEGEGLPGAVEAVRRCKARGLRMALATSAPKSVIPATLTALGIQDAFEVLCSAEDDALGKPHPAVYLRAAESLRLPPQRCLAFEDSINGMVSARAAQTIVIAVPGPEGRGRPEFSLAAQTLHSLETVDDAWLDALGVGR